MRIEYFDGWSGGRNALTFVGHSVDRRRLRNLVQLGVILQLIRCHLVIEFVNAEAYRISNCDVLGKLYLQWVRLMLCCQEQAHLRCEVVLL